MYIVTYDELKESELNFVSFGILIVVLNLVVASQNVTFSIPPPPEVLLFSSEYTQPLGGSSDLIILPVKRSRDLIIYEDIC